MKANEASTHAQPRAPVIIGMREIATSVHPKIDASTYGFVMPCRQSTMPAKRNATAAKVRHAATSRLYVQMGVIVLFVQNLAVCFEIT